MRTFVISRSRTSIPCNSVFCRRAVYGAQQIEPSHVGVYEVTQCENEGEKIQTRAESAFLLQTYVWGTRTLSSTGWVVWIGSVVIKSCCLGMHPARVVTPIVATVATVTPVTGVQDHRVKALICVQSNGQGQCSQETKWWLKFFDPSHNCCGYGACQSDYPLPYSVLV